ncbi:hypothetical protein TWF751_000079 [Orbilia oligospora]|nr:hypothetical protein TWF751_000079 [Orbilia oligospora]
MESSFSFDQFVSGADSLVTQTQRSLSLPSTAPGNEPGFSYQLSTNLTLSLSNDWEIVQGFNLHNVTLRSTCDINKESGESNETTLRVSIELEATATIGSYLFLVSAKVPNLQAGKDIKLLLSLSATSTVKVDELVEQLQSISKDTHSLSSFIDSQLQNNLSQPTSADLEINLIKRTTSSGFSFASLMLAAGTDLIYRTQVSSSELELTSGRFFFGLRKEDDSYDFLVQLRGQVEVDTLSIEAALEFKSGNGNGIIAELEIKVSKEPLSPQGGVTMSNLLSLGQIPSTIISIDALQVPMEFALLKRQLSQPRLDLSLYFRFRSTAIEILDIRAYADGIFHFAPPAFGGLTINNVAFVVRKDENGTVVFFGGNLRIIGMTFEVDLRFSNESIALKGYLRPDNIASLAHLGAIRPFNLDIGQGDVTNLVTYARLNPVGGDSGLTLLAALMPQSGERCQCSFDATFIPTSSLPTTGEALDMSKYRVKRVSLSGQYGFDWTLIPGRVVLRNIGARFDLNDPKDPLLKRVYGFIYGSWSLSSSTLWVYVLGSSTATSTDFWAGLTIKSGPSGAGSLLNILKDPAFLGPQFQFPNWDLKDEVTATPDASPLLKGLEIDGTLLAHFKKPEELDPPVNQTFKMVELEAKVKVTSQFNLFENRTVVDGNLIFRVADPLSSARKYETTLHGSIVVDGVFYLVIKANLSAPRISKLSTEEEFLQKNLIPEERNTQPASPADEIDVSATAVIGATNSPPNVLTILNSSLTSGDIATSIPDIQIPADYPMQKGSLLTSTSFSMTLKVAKKTTDNSRYIRRLVLLVTTASNQPWAILGASVVLERATLCLRIDEPSINQNKQTQLYLDGTIRIGKNLAATGQVSYVDDTTKARAAIKMAIKEAVTAIEPQPLEMSSLVTHDVQSAAVLLFASLDVKNGAVENYRLAAASVGRVELLKNAISLKDVKFEMKGDIPGGKRIIVFDGSIVFGTDSNALVFGAAVTWATGYPLLIEGKINATLESIVQRVLFTSLDTIASNHPPLNNGIGFDGWDKDVVPKPSSSWSAVAGLVFEETPPLGRILKSISVTYVTKAFWVIISNYLWMNALRLNATVTLPEKTLSLGCTAKINMKKRPDLTNQEPWIVGIVMAISNTSFDFTVKIPAGMDTTDIVYAITSSSIEIPRIFALPVFRGINLRVEWEPAKQIIIDGNFMRSGETWEIPKLFGNSIVKMKKPSIRGTITLGSPITAKASLHGLMKLFGTIDAEVEFVLPKGPLRVNGHDITEIIEIVTYLWELLRTPAVRGGPPPTTAPQAALAIGEFISSVAAVNTALAVVDIAGVVIASGLLGGALWLAMKAKIITRIVQLEGSIADKKSAESKIRDGLATNEDPSVPKFQPILDLPDLPILINGDFETGNLDGWGVTLESPACSYQLLSPGFTGSYRFLARVPSGETRTPPSPYCGIKLSQRLATSAIPRQYNFTIRYKFLSYKNDCYVNVFVNGRQIMGCRSNNKDLVNQIQTARAQFTASAPNALLEIYCSVCAYQSMNFELDSITVSTVLITQ